MKIKDFYFSIVLIFSILMGLTFPNQFILLAPFTTIFLMVILFLSALKIELKEVIITIKNKTKLVILTTFFILVILPIIIYFITFFIFPTFAPAFFILSLAPIGMTVPFLIDLMKGNKGLALVLTILTSLLAPITIPFLIDFVIGNEVEVNFIGMFTTLIKIIFIPFICAWVIKIFYNNKINQVSSKFNNISTLLLGFLFAIIVAIHSDVIRKILFNWEEFFLYIIPLLSLFIFLFIIPWIFFIKIEKKEKFTIIICSVFMNFILMIVIASEFFPDSPKIIIPLILSIIPWTISLIFLKQFRSNMSNKIN